ncbi:hypothetical protein EBME_1923 [bacterium endosymbiont of Mortierella elongata FMR23-6]|nr:hypothetical protein EBME_1923 [bacterium endosymbiont of Mortierella elongata FMR23-6]
MFFRKTKKLLFFTYIPLSAMYHRLILKGNICKKRHAT